MANTGTMFALVAHGYIEDIVDPSVHDNYSSFDNQYTVFPEQGGLTRQVKLPSRSGERIKPDCIIIEQLDHIIRLKQVEIYIVPSLTVNVNLLHPVCKINIDFLRQIYPDMISFREGKVLYNLHLENFLGPVFGFPDGYLNSTDIWIRIILTDEVNVSGIKVLSTCQLLDIRKRDALDFNRNHQQCMQLPILQHIKSTVHVNERSISFCICHGGPVNGFFIETRCPVSALTRFMVKLNGHAFVDHDDVQLGFYGRQYGPNLLYIPIDTRMNPFSMNLQSCLNLSRIDNINITVTSDQPLEYVTIHNISSNILTYESGLVWPMYDYWDEIARQTRSWGDAVIANDTVINISTRPVNKKYTGSENCLISMCPIDPDMEYIQCNVCEKPFIIEHLRSWLNVSRSCPHCRQLWTVTQSYINK
jgi:hypothetical protein